MLILLLLFSPLATAIATTMPVTVSTTPIILNSYIHSGNDKHVAVVPVTRDNLFIQRQTKRNRYEQDLIFSPIILVVVV